MDPNAGQTPEQRLRFWVRELGLYAVTALFLAFSPLFRDHWIVVQGISWFLSLAIVARIIDVVTASAVEAAPTASANANGSHFMTSPFEFCSCTKLTHRYLTDIFIITSRQICS